MSDPRPFPQLQDVLLDDEFPALDLALRRGRHIDRDDLAWYQLLGDAQEHLETFYRRYGCELVHKTDGYYYLLPTNDRLPRRHLAVGDMLVGQALALLYLDPASVERGGLVSREDVVAQLVAALGEEALVRTFHAKKRRIDERAAHKVVRAKIGDAIKRLAALGFVEPDRAGAGPATQESGAPKARSSIGAPEEQLRLRPSLLRFAEPVRGVAAPEEALARLVAEGEVAMADELAEDLPEELAEEDPDEGDGEAE